MEKSLTKINNEKKILSQNNSDCSKSLKSERSLNQQIKHKGIANLRSFQKQPSFFNSNRGQKCELKRINSLQNSKNLNYLTTQGKNISLGLEQLQTTRASFRKNKQSLTSNMFRTSSISKQGECGGVDLFEESKVIEAKDFRKFRLQFNCLHNNNNNNNNNRENRNNLTAATSPVNLYNNVKFSNFANENLYFEQSPISLNSEIFSEPIPTRNSQKFRNLKQSIGTLKCQLNKERNKLANIEFEQMEDLIEEDSLKQNGITEKLQQEIKELQENNQVLKQYQQKYLDERARNELINKATKNLIAELKLSNLRIRELTKEKKDVEGKNFELVEKRDQEKEGNQNQSKGKKKQKKQQKQEKEVQQQKNGNLQLPKKKCNQYSINYNSPNYYYFPSYFNQIQIIQSPLAQSYLPSMPLIIQQQQLPYNPSTNRIKFIQN